MDFCNLIDGFEQLVKTGDVIRIPVGCKHSIIADTCLDIIEVQIGKEISAEDKIKIWESEKYHKCPETIRRKLQSFGLYETREQNPYSDYEINILKTYYPIGDWDNLLKFLRL